MSVAYLAAVKTGRMQVVADKIAGKALGAATGAASTGTLVIGDNTLSGATGVLATFTIGTGITGAVSGSVLDIKSVVAVLTVAASASGTAAKAEVRDNSGAVIIGGLTVGTSGTDVTISNTTITNGGNVTLNSATATHN